MKVPNGLGGILASQPNGPANVPKANDILHDLGFFGHYLHVHAGGRGGKQFVLITLDKHGGHLTQRQLLEQSKISSAALSEVLGKLEGEELLRRTPCEEDRRTLDIELTDLGKSRAQQIRMERDQFEVDSLACFSTAERSQLKELLDRLVEHWKTLEDKEVVA